MTLKEIAALSNARVIHENGHLDKVIRHAFAADLMSDVLRLDDSHHGTSQLTGDSHGRNV